MEKYIDGLGQTVSVHSKEKCEGQHCVIHNPSDHPLRRYPTSWDEERKLMYRVIEEHRIKLMDPDEVSYQKRKLAENAVVVY